MAARPSSPMPGVPSCSGALFGYERAARADNSAAAVPGGSLARHSDVLLVVIAAPSDAALGR